MTRTDHSLTISYPAPSLNTGANIGSTNGKGRKGWFFVVTQTIGLWQQRRNLAQLDDAALRDIGLTYREALTEADRPLWDVPANWLR